MFVEENPFENVIWKMASILSRPQCVKLVIFKLISRIDILSISCEIALRSIPKDLTDD